MSSPSAAVAAAAPMKHQFRRMIWTTTATTRPRTRSRSPAALFRDRDSSSCATAARCQLPPTDGVFLRRHHSLTNITSLNSNFPPPRQITGLSDSSQRLSAAVTSSSSSYGSGLNLDDVTSPPHKLRLEKPFEEAQQLQLSLADPGRPTSSSKYYVPATTTALPINHTQSSNNPMVTVEV